MHTSAYALVFKNNIQYRYTCFEDIYFVKNRTREFYMEIHISYIYMYDITYFVISFRNNGFLLFKKENGKNDIRKIITFRYDGICY